VVRFTPALLFKLLRALNECTEWGQVRQHWRSAFVLWRLLCLPCSPALSTLILQHAPQHPRQPAMPCLLAHVPLPTVRCGRQRRGLC
jgi:hypothetical protein